MTWLLLIACAYLLGSISWSVLIVQALRGVDVRTVGSGNAGATNVLRAAGGVPAVSVLVLDVAKGVVPVLFARAVSAPGPVIGAVAVAAVVGHVYPLYYEFRGGKGVATVTGALSTLAPLPALLAATLFALVVGATRWVSLGSVTAIGLFPFLVYLCGRVGWTRPAPPWLLVAATATALLVVVKHRANLERLLAGTEPRLGERHRHPKEDE